MNKTGKLLSFVIVLILIFNINSKVSAYIGEEEYKEAEELGEKLGYYDGLIKGFENSSKSSKITYYEAKPSIEEITIKYKDYLKEQNNIFDNYFLSGYYTGFEKGYNETSIGDGFIVKTDARTKYTDYAIILGLLTGEIYGYRDFYANKNANISKALPSDKVLTKMFNLDRLNYQDRYSFLNIFKGKFKEGYQEGYGIANFEPMKISYEEGITHGEYFGNILGRTSGSKDYFDNKTRDYKRHIPSNTNIIREYSLNKDGDEYREGFLIGFRRAYEESYNENFRTMNVDEHRRSYEKGYEKGKVAGKIKGEIKAKGDFYLKLDNNWKRYYPTQSGLIREYSLTTESERYRDGFFSGYIEGFAQGYGLTIQQLSEDIIVKKSIVKEVPISGGEVNSLDNISTLNIDKGTYYNPVIVTIDMLPDNYYSIDEGFIKASGNYSINILNKSNETDNKKDIELKFEYYGKDNGGIYKLVNDKWLYISSYIEDGYIKALIKPNSFKEQDNVYCVLVDKNTKVLLDIRNHWARDEITAYQRREIISGYSNNKFMPDNKILKGEFLSILSKVYNWELSYDKGNVNYEKIINYAANKGYINNALDNPFRFKEGITYKEAEAIMRKVTGSENYHWYNFSSKILYEKLYKSKSYNSMNNYLSRAEAVYMLYVLNEWRY
ncbi:S-layer homology domain-containing protein [Clostridium sp. Cult2]|uniref:S-layer homology domain-containing protein n=1 Tax=Clostridium sp. Cult2 TaxID=2079003 RepID=UPI001F383E8F|nr:S-layer homology domain-containing protein [Clostridium sp. Cult2]MCF6465633.1 hypothetical protein [Clostridium sp. Cult2]